MSAFTSMKYNHYLLTGINNKILANQHQNHEHFTNISIQTYLNDFQGGVILQEKSLTKVTKITMQKQTRTFQTLYQIDVCVQSTKTSVVIFYLSHFLCIMISRYQLLKLLCFSKQTVFPHDSIHLEAVRRHFGSSERLVSSRIAFLLILLTLSSIYPIPPIFTF